MLGTAYPGYLKTTIAADSGIGNENRMVLVFGRSRIYLYINGQKIKGVAEVFVVEIGTFWNRNKLGTRLFEMMCMTCGRDLAQNACVD